MTNLIKDINNLSDEISKSINGNSLGKLLSLMSGNENIQKEVTDQNGISSRKILLFSKEKVNNSLESEKEIHLKFMEKELNKINKQMVNLENENSYKSNLILEGLKKKKEEMLDKIKDVENLYSTKSKNLKELSKYDNPINEVKDQKDEQKISYIGRSYVSLIMNKIKSKINTNEKIIKLEIESAKEELSPTEFKKVSKDIINKCKKLEIELPEEIINILSKENKNKKEFKISI